MSDKTLAEYRVELDNARMQIDKFSPILQDLAKQMPAVRTKYKRAYSRAKAAAFDNAKTKEEKLPTVINARADIDAVVMAAQDELDALEGRLEAGQIFMKRLEEDCNAIKKCIGSIETEMRNMGG
jgi:chromosome segregation ATPase